MKILPNTVLLLLVLAVASVAAEYVHAEPKKEGVQAVRLHCNKRPTPAGQVTQTAIKNTGVVLNHEPITFEKSRELVTLTMFVADEVKGPKGLSKTQVLSFARKIAADLKICIYN